MLTSIYHPIFDRFAKQYHEEQELFIRRLSQTVEQTPTAMYEEKTLPSLLEPCKKVILTQSAVAMLDDILLYSIPKESFVFQPGPDPLWIEIDTKDSPFLSHRIGVRVRGVFLSQPYNEKKQEAIKKMLPSTQHAFIDALYESLRNRHYLYLVAEDLTLLFQFSYDMQRQSWAIEKEHLCPYGRCGRQEQGGKNRQPCHRCQSVLTLFSFWLPTVWVALQGAFQQTDSEIFTQRVRRCERSKNNPKKKRVIEHEYSFRIVRTIDISIKPPKLLHEEDKQEEQVNSYGSWVKRAEARDPNLVHYEIRAIPERERTLSHPRYANYIKKHGTNKVKVKAHTKSFPTLNDPERVTRVRARRYENPPTDGNKSTILP